MAVRKMEGARGEQIYRRVVCYQKSGIWWSEDAAREAIRYLRERCPGEFVGVEPYRCTERKRAHWHLTSAY